MKNIAFEQLAVLIDKAREAIGISTTTYGTRVLTARALPEQRVNNLKRVEPTVSYYGNRLTEEDALAFGRVKSLAIKIERADGERQRDAALREIAADLEAWRAVLPDLAARACIELGVAARALRNEGRGGSVASEGGADR